MVFEVLKDSDGELRFATAARARRGRGVLYALAPWLAYLLGLSALFPLAVATLSAPGWARTAAVIGACTAAALTPAAYGLGYRAREQVEATRTAIRVLRRPSLGASRLTSIPVAELTGLRIDPAIRSLGADLVLVALHRDGRRIAVAEGEPHLGQLRQLGGRAAEITGLPLEAARPAHPASSPASNDPRSQPKQ